MSDTPPPPVDPFSEPPKPPTVPVLRPLAEVPTSNPVSEPVVLPDPPPFGAPPVVAVEAETPKRRRGVLVGVVAAVVVAVAAVGGVLALRSGGDTYSLKAASSSATGADKVAFSMRMEIAGQAIDMSARIDTAAKLMAMSADIPGLTDGGTVSMVMDLGAKRLFMDASAIPGAEALQKKWVSLDLSKVPGADQSLGAVTGASPLDAASLFAGGKNATDLGFEDLDGERVKHYRVAVPVDELKKAQPGLFSQLGDAAIELPTTIDYDVWVTKGNQMRKLGFSMPVAGQSIDVSMVVTAVGTIDPIVLPANSDVADMTDFLGDGA